MQSPPLPPPDTTIQIHVKSLTGAMVPLTLPATATVKDLRFLLQEKLTVNPQRIVYQGRLLSGRNKLLTDLGVRDGSTLHLVWFCFGHDVPYPAFSKVPLLFSNDEFCDSIH